MPGIDEKPNSFRFRVRNPSLFTKGTLRTKKITAGVSIVHGTLKSEPKKGRKVQSIVFNKNTFKTVAKVRAWLKAHPSVKKYADIGLARLLLSAVTSRERMYAELDVDEVEVIDNAIKEELA